MVKFPWKYKWSSAAYHCGEISDDPEPLTDIQVQILELLETDPTIKLKTDKHLGCPFFCGMTAA
jgi:hypothetical protein